jgi:hypothetical protein
MTIGEALDAFEDEWIEPLAFTPQTSYRRTLRLFRMELGDRVAQPLETMVSATAALLVEQIETGMAVNKRIDFPAELVQRGSARRPPHAL